MCFFSKQGLQYCSSVYYKTIKPASTIKKRPGRNHVDFRTGRTLYICLAVSDQAACHSLFRQVLAALCQQSVNVNMRLHHGLEQIDLIGGFFRQKRFHAVDLARDLIGIGRHQQQGRAALLSPGNNI